MNIHSSILRLLHQACEWKERRLIESAMGWGHIVYPLRKNSCPGLDRTPKPKQKVIDGEIYDHLYEVTLSVSSTTSYSITKAFYQRYWKDDGKWIEVGFDDKKFIERMGVRRGGRDDLVYASFLHGFRFNPEGGTNRMIETQKFYYDCEVYNVPARIHEWERYMSGRYGLSIIARQMLIGDTNDVDQ